MDPGSTKGLLLLIVRSRSLSVPHHLGSSLVTVTVSLVIMGDLASSGFISLSSTLSVTGNLVLSQSSGITLSGSLSTPHLQVSGCATLNGSLDILLPDLSLDSIPVCSFAPPVADLIKVI